MCLQVYLTNPFCRHLIQSGRAVGRLWVVAGEVPIPQVISIDDNDVGQFLCTNAGGAADEKSDVNETRQNCGEMHAVNLRWKLGGAFTPRGEYTS